MAKKPVRSKKAKKKPAGRRAAGRARGGQRARERKPREMAMQPAEETTSGQMAGGPEPEGAPAEEGGNP